MISENKNRRFTHSRFCISELLFFLHLLINILLPIEISSQMMRPESEGGRSFAYKTMDSITDEQRKRISDDIRMNLGTMSKFGSSIFEPYEVRLTWPTRKAPGSDAFEIGQVGNFVDQNSAFPNQILDWNCGLRTYDRSDGYNHAGTDIVSFPFPWTRMDRNDVEVVAAAPGIIVSKNDGNFDQNCGAIPALVNSIHILHADGSIAWYMHLKNGSLTRKPVGASVERGEFLGVPGSSGVSNVPHLHLEIYDMFGNLQDPYQGACNTKNNFSWWVKQEPYRVPRVNALLTASAVPSFPSCPQREVLNEKIVFQPSDTIVPITTIRDILAGHELHFSIVRPDESVFAAWSFVSPSTQSAMTRWATWELPPDAEFGAWTFRVDYLGKIYDRKFFVGEPRAVWISGRLTSIDDRSVTNATISFLNGLGQIVAQGKSNSFGYYMIKNIPAGYSYKVNISSSMNIFTERNVTVLGPIEDLDLRSIGRM